MFGISRLNTLAKAASAPAGARSSAATFSQGTTTLPTTGGKFNGYLNAPIDGNAAITSVPADTTWYTNSNKIWTIEFWMRPSTTSFSSASAPVVRSSPANTGMSLANTGTSGQLGLWLGGTNAYSFSPSTTFTHYAITCDGAGQVSFYLGGSKVVTNASFANNYNQRVVNFGLNWNNANGMTWRFDEIRISNSVRYTATFTPSASAFTNDANTLALFHFDGGTAADDTA